MNTYDIGDRVRVTGTFTNTAGTATDPTAITIMVKDRDAVVVTYTYAGGTVTKSGTGVYYVDVTVNTEGIWDYRVVGTGTIVAAGEGQFVVRVSYF